MIYKNGLELVVIMLAIILHCSVCRYDITEIDQSADGILYVRQFCSTRANMLAFTTFCLTNARRFR